MHETTRRYLRISSIMAGLARVVGAPGGAVVVQGKEVRASIDERALLLGEVRQAAAEEPAHRRWVVALATEDGVGEPAQVEAHPAHRGCDVRRVVALGLTPVAVQRDADLPTLPLLVLLPIQGHGMGVRDEHVVAGDVRVDRPVRKLGMARCLAPAGSQVREGPRLIECEPHLHTVAKGRKAYIDKIEEIFQDLLGRLQSLIVPCPPGLLLRRVEEALWQVPVVERDVRRDALLQQAVDKVVVEVHALFVDAVLLLARWVDAWPSHAESVVLQAHCFH
mmetsp:Transcript_42738/g.118985  ORF Transcript_42738/g.118985 Transcript_42738/m.118985 type:complete len:278 (+) Transcript_42738:981-1814(+)